MANLLSENNLSDVENASTSRNNLDVYSKDEVKGLFSSSEDGLGDALVAVKQPFTGAVTRTQHDKNRERISISDFGSVMDGTTDDTAALQAAIDAASSIRGGDVIVPPGRICIAGTITIPTYVHVIGAGPRSTEFVITSTTGDVFTIQSGGYNGIQKCSFYSSDYRASGSAIVIEGGRQILVEDIFMQHQCWGISVEGGVEQWIRRCEILDCTPTDGIGIAVSGGNDTFISEVVMDASGDTQPKAGIAIFKTDAVWATNCDIIHHQYGVMMAPHTDQYITWMMLNCVACDQCSSSGMFISPSNDATIRGVFISSCWTSSNGRGVHIRIDDSGGSISGVTINDHRCLANSMDGILVESGADIHIRGGIYSGNSGASGNNHVYPGIQFSPNMTNFSVISARIGEAFGYGKLQTYGIYIGTGCNVYQIANNDLTGNYTGPFFDGSYTTSSNRDVSNNISYQTVATATVTLPENTTQVTVSHALGIAPESVIVIPLNTGAMNYWVGGLSSNSFTIYTDASSTSARNFQYRIAIYNA